MTAKVEKAFRLQMYLKILTSTYVKQRRKLINTISDEQLSVLSKAIFNVLKEMCPLLNVNKSRLCKNKTILRKLHIHNLAGSGKLTKSICKKFKT